MNDNRRRRALDDLERAVAELPKLAGRVDLGVVTKSALAKEPRALYGTFSIL
jgi:hypothetical protein